jgi:hypothetical protein
MSLFTFLNNAPCRDSDPWLFDQYQLDLAQPGLAYCRNCKFWDECDSQVKPESSNYDGIAAGKVWRNGNLLARLSPTSPYPLIVNEEREVFISVETLAVRRSDLLTD